VVEGFNFYLTGNVLSPAEPIRLAALEPVTEAEEMSTGPLPGPARAAVRRPPPIAAPAAALGPAAASRSLPTFVSSDWRDRNPIFAVQLASYRERLTAERQARSLAALVPAPVHVLVADLGSKGTWYRVLAGELHSPGEAIALRRDLLSRGLGEIGPAYRVEGNLSASIRP
jgi:hypothetical protein